MYIVRVDRSYILCSVHIVPYCMGNYGEVLSLRMAVPYIWVLVRPVRTRGRSLLGNFNNWPSDGPLAAAPSAALASRLRRQNFCVFFSAFYYDQCAALRKKRPYTYSTYLAKARAARNFFGVNFYTQNAP